MHNQKIDGIDIEAVIKNITARIKGIPQDDIARIYHQIATDFDEEFSKEQIIYLYRMFKQLFYFIPMSSLISRTHDEFYNKKDRDKIKPWYKGID